MAISNPNGFSVPRITREIISSLGLITPQSYEKYIENYPGILNETYVMAAESLPGVLQFSPNKSYWRYEDNRKPLPSFEVAADVSGLAGAGVVVTLSAGSHQKTSAGVGSYSPVSKGQIWVNDVDNQAFEVTAVNKSAAGAHTATLRPVDSTAVTTIVAATAFFKYYGHDSVKEGSGADEGIYGTISKVQRDLSAIRVDKSYTDLAMFERLDIPGEVTYYTFSSPEMEKEFEMVQELRLMFGQKYDNLSHSNNQNTDSLGLIPTIKKEGVIYNAPTGGNTIDKAYFQGLTRQNDADGYTNEYHGLLDTEFQMLYEDYLDTYNQNGGIIYASFGGSKEVAINRNFSSHSIYGTTYHTRKYSYFNSARTHGARAASGYWNKTALWIPQGEVIFEGNRFRNFNIHYMASSEGGPINHFLQDGGLLNPKGSLDMTADLSLVAWKGINAYNLKAYKLTQLS